MRDYIHVVDLAIGHIKALQNISTLGCEAINLGTGNGYSVLEVLRAFEKVSGEKIPYRIQSRRTGDIASCYANAQKAQKLLGWNAKRDIVNMCEDAWNWQSKNEQGV